MTGTKAPSSLPCHQHHVSFDAPFAGAFVAAFFERKQDEGAESRDEGADTLTSDSRGRRGRQAARKLETRGLETRGQVLTFNLLGS